jgi:hypothetical protein
MKLRRTALTLVLCLALVAPMAAKAAPQNTNPFASIPIVGSIVSGGTFNGVLSITRFVAQGGVISAVGTLTGTLTDALGNVLGTITNLPINIPLTSTQGSSCQILHLELGPLDLNLLGLMIHLNRVVLDITAQSGPGNLLGNLLCAIAGLLDNNASGNAIVRLLNQLLGLLG